MVWPRCGMLSSAIRHAYTDICQYASIYASEITVSSIGSEPSERSRKGRRLRGNGTLSAVSHWKRLRRLGGCDLEPLTSRHIVVTAKLCRTHDQPCPSLITGVCGSIVAKCYETKKLGIHDN